MKRLLGPTFLFATVLLFAACDPESPSRDNRPKPKASPGGFSTPVKHDNHPSETVDAGVGEDPAPPRHVDRTPQTPDNTAVNKTPTAPPPAGAPEYAKPVPGKPGFVTSPYKPYDGLVDVRGFAPGTELQDPYEKGRTFLVPAQ